MNLITGCLGFEIFSEYLNVFFFGQRNVGERDLNKARTERVHALVKDLCGDVDEASQEFLQREITNIDERWLQVEKRIGLLPQDEPDDVSTPVDVESQIIQPRIITTLESEPTELPSPESESEDSTTKSEDKTTPIEPYTGTITLDINEWKTVVSNLRNFLIRMQLLIRDIDSTNYLEMRECERDTKVYIYTYSSFINLRTIDVIRPSYIVKSKMAAPMKLPAELNGIFLSRLQFYKSILKLIIPQSLVTCGLSNNLGSQYILNKYNFCAKAWT